MVRPAAAPSARRTQRVSALGGALLAASAPSAAGFVVNAASAVAWSSVAFFAGKLFLQQQVRPAPPPALLCDLPGTHWARGWAFWRMAAGWAGSRMTRACAVCRTLSLPPLPLLQSQADDGARKECETCGGTGYVECWCKRWSDGDARGCGTCRGSRRMMCSSCSGGGTAVPIEARITISPDEHISNFRRYK